MGPRERTRDIELGGGQLDGIDPRLVEAPNVLAIDNALFNKLGRWESRHGYGTVTSAGLPSAGAEAIYVRAGAHLLQQQHEGTVALVQSQNTYAGAPGDAPDLPYPAEVWRKDIFRSHGVNIREVDVATIGSYTCYAWSGCNPEDPYGAAPVDTYTLITFQDGIGAAEEIVLGPVRIGFSTARGRVRCEAVGARFVVTYTHLVGGIRWIIAQTLNTSAVLSGWTPVAFLVGTNLTYGKHELLADPDGLHIHISFPRDGFAPMGAPRGLGLRKYLVSDIAAGGVPAPVTEYSNLNTMADGGQAMHLFQQGLTWRLLVVAIGYDTVLGDPHTLYRIILDAQTYLNPVAAIEVAADPDGLRFRNVTIVQNSVSDAWIVWDTVGDPSFPTPTVAGAPALPPAGAAGHMPSVNWRLFTYATEALAAATRRRYNLALASHGFTLRRSGGVLACVLVTFDYAGASHMMDGTALDGTLQPTCFIAFPYNDLFPNDTEDVRAGPDIGRLGVVARIGQDTGAQAPRLAVETAGPPVAEINGALPHARSIGTYAWRTALCVFVREDITNLPVYADVPPPSTTGSAGGSFWTTSSGVARRTGIYVPLAGTGPVLGVARFDWTNSGVGNQGSVQRDQNVYMGGGAVWQHDGVRATENAMHLAPEAPYVQVQTLAPPTADHNFWVRVLFVQTDASGAIHRSAPSAPTLVDPASSGAVGRQFSVTVFRPPLCAWDGVGADTWAVEVYRTLRVVEGGNIGGPYYLVARTTFGTADGGTDGMVSALYDVSGVTLAARPSLYVEGGRFAVEPPPACRVLCQADNRVWIRGDEDRGYLRYSMLLEDGIAPEFNGALQIRISDGTHDITAASSMDESLVVFTEDEIWTIVGDGPNNTGGGGPYVARRIASDIGCVGPRSVALTRHGLVFKSRRGIELLTRGFEVKTPFLGKACQDLITPSSIVTSAVVVPDRNEVRFSVRGASYLVVWNYEHDKWSRWTNHAGIVDATIWRNNYLYLHSAGKCRSEGAGYEDRNITTDAAESIVMQAILPWFTLGAKQGFQRVWKATFLGEWRSAHAATIEVQYNYDEDSAWEVAPVYDWTTDRLPAGAGGYPPQGADRYQFSYAPARQAHQSVRFRITINPGATPGPGAILSMMTLKFGLYGGMMRLEPAADH